MIFRTVVVHGVACGTTNEVNYFSISEFVCRSIGSWFGSLFGSLFGSSFGSSLVSGSLVVKIDSRFKT